VRRNIVPPLNQPLLRRDTKMQLNISIYHDTPDHTLYSIYYRNKGASSSVCENLTSSLESYCILFPTYFRYSCSGGKFKHTYTGLLFRKVAYPRYEVPWFVQYIDFVIYIYIYIVAYICTHKCKQSSINRNEYQESSWG
jgi:hypothetical protein